MVASHAIGSVPFLMKHGENGLIFRNEDQDDLNNKVKKLLDEPKTMESLGLAAYKTLSEVWNADNAAERFLKLVEYLNKGNKGTPFTEGPCSIAQNVNNKNTGKLLIEHLDFMEN